MRIAVVVGIIVVAVIVGLIARRFTNRAAPTQPTNHAIPSMLDRRDFAHADAPWLVAAFVSPTCESCQRVSEVIRPLESSDVAIALIINDVDKALHEKYNVTAVPMTLLCDSEGVVRQFFLGAPTAADLWAAVAELREPGSTPVDECSH